MSPSRIPEGQAQPRFDRVDKALRRHAKAPFRPPISPAQAAAFQEMLSFVSGEPARPWQLDAGCGTGESTAWLSRRAPGQRILGIDKSAHRLSRAPQSSEHLAFVRADLDRALPQMVEAKLRPQRIHLLYPNPWPKPAHFRRRWHGHPTFRDLLQLSEQIELRTNWEVYAREFAYALSVALGREIDVESFEARDPISAFERKYAASGHPLFRVRTSLEG